MARRRAGASDNLGLLLDTMCNAFGGVIFIAMLLAVLSQFAEVTSEPVPDLMTLKEQEGKLSQLLSEVDTLRLAHEQQSQVMAAMESVVAVQDQLERVSESNKQLTETLDRLQAEDKQINAIQARLDAVRKLKKAIQLASKGDVRKLDLPKLMGSTKLTFFLIIKWNRLFILRQTSSAQVHGPVNSADVAHTVSQRGNGITAHEYDPISGRGIPLDTLAWKGSAGVESLLKHVPAGEYSLQFAVYPDSYAALRIARAFFADKGYESNWHIMTQQDEKLVLQSGGFGAPPPIQK